MLTLSCFQRLLAALCFAVFLSSGSGRAVAEAVPAPAQPVTTTATYGNWVLRCVRLQLVSANGEQKAGRAANTDETCEVVQTIQADVQGQPQPIAQIAFGRLPGDKKLTVTAVLPVNISISRIVRLSGNGKADAEERGGMDLAWVRCANNSCFANTTIDEASLKVLRLEKEGRLIFANAAGESLAIPISWSGLDQSLTALGGR